MKSWVLSRFDLSVYVLRIKNAKHTLPEGEENDTLDSAELENRIERSEQVLSGKVEEKQSIKRQGDANIVNAGYV